MEEDSFIASV